MVINNVRAMNWNMHTIKNLRKYMGKSQVEFSNDLGVRQQTISEWETGVYEPRGGSITLLNLISTEIGFDTWYSEKLNNVSFGGRVVSSSNKINSIGDKLKTQNKAYSNGKNKTQKNKIRNNLNHLPLPI
jgi:DNA-binding XRE family transcriptional regulator|tara:strand:+ start:368 stop:757 length:390 start_codon:yes stop_codon:yes gene_type:complete